MVTQRQKKEIERLMRRIKEVKKPAADNSPENRQKIERRTQELYNYLVQEGIVIPDE